jgi:hypothetical protein
MGFEDALSKVKSAKGVINAFPMDGPILESVCAEEDSVRLSGGMILENRALDECLRRNVHICVFSRDFFEPMSDITMLMEDAFGNVVGHDVPECMIEEYKCRTDIVWLSDSFVLYPNVTSRSEPRLVMLPRKVRLIGAADGVFGAVGYYPSITSHNILREHFVIGDDPDVSSMIIGMDTLQEPSSSPNVLTQRATVRLLQFGYQDPSYDAQMPVRIRTLVSTSDTVHGPMHKRPHAIL